MNIYLVKRNVTVPQEDKSDKEKKRKKSNLLLYNKSPFKRSVKLKIIKHIVYADDLVSQSRWLKKTVT
jgi:hypothetical protein